MNRVRWKPVPRIRPPDPRRGSWLARASLVALALTLAPPAPAARRRPPGTPVPRSAVAADSLAVRVPPSPEPLAALTAWARAAALDDLVYVLRRPAAQLGDLEAVAVETAFERTPSDRADLRERLAARRGSVAPVR